MKKELCIADPNPLNLSISPAQLDMNMMQLRCAVETCRAVCIAMEKDLNPAQALDAVQGIVYLLDDTYMAFAKEVYEKCAEYLGRGLSVIIDIINPEAVVIGSIYARNEEFFYKRVKEVIGREALSQNAESCKILPAELGESIGDFAALGVLF